jgi:glycosyltransferase involved in cell wall biosynthesis
LYGICFDLSFCYKIVTHSVAISYTIMELNKQTQRINPTTFTAKRIHLLEIIGNASIGGMENYLKDFLAHLPPDQFTVTCICPYESSFTASLRELGVEEIYITPIADDPSWRSIQLTVEISKLHGIDLLHAHMPKAHVLAGLAGSLLHKPVVATIHGMNVTSHELGITRGVGSHVITNCQEAFTQGLAMGIAPERLYLVRNGVDTSVFTYEPTTFDLHGSINVAKDTRLVGFVGRLEHEKGPDMFIRAAEYVHCTYPDVHFVIAGEGCMRDQLEKMCIQMRIDKYVHFIGWHPNPAALYSNLDILAHTSRSDGTSLVLLEAMACSRPTVGIAVGGVREIIENESTGMLAGEGDWEEVGIKIIQLLQEPDRMKIMGEAARVRLEQLFDVAKNTLRTAEVLRKVASSNLNGNGFTYNTMFPEPTRIKEKRQRTL